MTLLHRRGRRAARLGGLAAASVAALATAVPAASAMPTKPNPGWRLSAIPVKGTANLTSVVATGRAEAWAGGFKIGRSAGHSSTTARRYSAGTAAERPARPVPCQAEQQMFPTLMLHWTGHSWSSVAMPTVGRINFLSATGRNDVWASADCAMLHWDGRRWTSMSYPTIPGAEESTQQRVSAGGPQDAWLIGGTTDSSTGASRGYVQRWNGRRWQSMALPSLGNSWWLSAVTVRNPHDVWAVGTDSSEDRHEHLVILHWNGRTWKRLKEPAIDNRSIRRATAVRALSANDVWVVGEGLAAEGGGYRLPIMLHWNGRAWTSTPVPDGYGEVYDLVKNGRGLWAVGDTDEQYQMYTLRWNGKRWTRGSVPQPGTGGINDAAAIPGGGMWAVGSTGGPNNVGPYPFIARHA